MTAASAATETCWLQMLAILSAIQPAICSFWFLMPVELQGRLLLLLLLLLLRALQPLPRRYVEAAAS